MYVHIFTNIYGYMDIDMYTYEDMAIRICTDIYV